MLGDWGGTRSELEKQGYSFSLDYVGESLQPARRYDHDRTARYSDQFGLGTHLGPAKILGWDDAEFQLTITHRSGNNISMTASTIHGWRFHFGPGSLGPWPDHAPDANVVSAEIL